MNRTDRRLLAFIIAVVAILVVVVVLRDDYLRGLMEPSSPEPNGSRAVVKVLDREGITVTTQRTTSEAASAVRRGETVLITQTATLNPAQVDALASALKAPNDPRHPGRIVLLHPAENVLDVLAPSIRQKGGLDHAATVAAHCTDGPSYGARRLFIRGSDGRQGEPPERTYQVGAGAKGCFKSSEGFIVAQQDRVIAVGSTSMFRNDSIARSDNAAFTLNLLSQTSHVTWYLPSPTDPMTSEDKGDLLDHLPPWLLSALDWLLIPLILTLVMVGRRLGPVVIEPLPVTVRAQEVTLGRANLMRHARARTRAADALRSGTSRRLARLLNVSPADGLGPLTTALAQRTNRSQHELKKLLEHSPVTTDSELINLARDLSQLEKEIPR
ncbi:DUF4350 domain-containing protein [Devriesea agamarum]|uniref:DUF4350 domain-containing protein n=1 Tax=Devriesea agamarum TaxID=472569 RepID=UPI0012EE44E6|nr:DUF4350 domain-containing protein [Devriesea agamarum]